MKTYSAKPLELERKWWLIDAEGQTLGRLSTLIANLLRGKHKPQYTTHVDTGDFVVVVNADKIKVTGKKLEQKLYRHHTGYIGGLKTIVLKDLLEKHPTRALEKAVWGMLPHNRLGRQQIQKLKIYATAEHPHEAQKVEKYTDREVAQ